MKTYTHSFKGWGIHPTVVKIYITENAAGETLIGFEDLNNGTSVTNVSEQLATDIVKKEDLFPGVCRFFEWYSQYEGDVDEIIYTWDSNRKASQPVWKPFCSAENNPFKN